MATPGGIRAGRAYVLIEAVDATSKTLNAVGAKFTRWGARMASAGRGAVMQGLMASLPQFFAAKTFMAFDDAMRQVEARSDGTATEMENLREQARGLGRDSTTTAQQVGELMGILAQKGYNRKSIGEMTGPIRDLAEAGSEGGLQDTALAADLVAATLKMFKLEASEAGRVVDIMTAGVNASSATLADMAQALAYAGTIADEFGADLEDTVAAVGMLRDLEIEAGIAGTAIRNMYLEISNVDKVDKFNAKLQELTGSTMKFGTKAGEMRKPIAELLFELGEKTKDLGPLQKGDLFFTLFGKRAIVPAMSLQRGENPFSEMLSKIKDSDGVAKRTVAIMNAGIGGAWRRFKGMVMDAAIALGEALAPALMKVSAILRPYIDMFIKFVENNKGLVTIIAGLTLGLILFGVALWIAGSLLGAIGTIIGVFVAILGTLSALLPFIATAFAFLFSPIGLCVAAVLALLSAFLRLSDVGDSVSASIATWFQGRFAGLADIIKTTWGGVMKALSLGEFAAAWDIACQGMKIAFMQLAFNFRDIWTDFATFFVTGWEIIKDAVLRGVSYIEQFIFKIPGFFYKAFAQVAGFLDSQFRNMRDSLSWASGGMIDATTPAPTPLGKLAQEALANAGTRGKPDSFYERERKAITEQAGQNINAFVDSVATLQAAIKREKDKLDHMIGGLDKPNAATDGVTGGNPKDYLIPTKEDIQAAVPKMMGTALKGLQQGSMEAMEAYYKNKQEEDDSKIQEDQLDEAEEANENLAGIKSILEGIKLGVV